MFLYAHLGTQKTFFAWAVCFHITDHVLFSRELFIYLKIIYSYTRDYLKIFESKISQEYHHAMCNGATKHPAEKGLFACH